MTDSSNSNASASPGGPVTETDHRGLRRPRGNRHCQSRSSSRPKPLGHPGSREVSLFRVTEPASKSQTRVDGGPRWATKVCPQESASVRSRGASRSPDETTSARHRWALQPPRSRQGRNRFEPSRMAPREVWGRGSAVVNGRCPGGEGKTAGWIWARWAQAILPLASAGQATPGGPRAAFLAFRSGL
jgi:hypothetical protein